MSTQTIAWQKLDAFRHADFVKTTRASGWQKKVI